MHVSNAKRGLFLFQKKPPGKIRRTVPVFTNAMWWCIGDEHDHLARLLPPVHLQRLREAGGDRLGSVATSGGIQAREIAVDLIDIGREAKVARHVGVVLRRVITIGDEADAQVIAGLQLARLVDVVTDELDVLSRGGDVGSLAPSAVLHENEIAVVCRIQLESEQRDRDEICTYSILRSSSTGGAGRFWSLYAS
jgi:hypothetical protein